MVPFGGQHQFLEQMGLFLKFIQLVGRFSPGQNQKQAPFISPDLEKTDITGGRHHESIEIIIVAFQAVDIDGGAAPEMEKFFLVLHFLTFEKLNCVINGIILLNDGNVLFRYFHHSLFNFPGQLSIDPDSAENGAVAGVIQRKLDLDPDLFVGRAQDIPGRLDQHHLSCPYVGGVPGRILCRDK